MSLDVSLKMTSDKNQIYQDSLYQLLWYLSGHGGGDYSPTTRRDMVESILNDLNAKGLLKDQQHSQIANRLVSKFESHPFKSEVRNCMDTMPRKVDEVLGDVNAVFWIQD